MAYNKYTIENLAQAVVGATLTAWGTTLILGAWQGGLFPTTFPFILKLEWFTSWNVVRRNIVKCTARSGDTLTIVRSFENAPANYTAVSQTNISLQFEVWDIASLVISKEIIVDVQNEVTRLETAKLNRTNSLRLANWVWRTSYNDGGWNEQELMLWATGTVLGSNGSLVAPSWTLPTVNINWLTEDTAPDMDTDFFIEYDTSAAINKKILINKFKATNVEAIAGNIDNKFTTPLSAKSARLDSIGWRIGCDFNTNYQATSSWFILATSVWAAYNSNTNDILTGYIGTVSPATTVTAGNSNYSANAMVSFISICFPIMKGEWYRVTASSSSTYTYFAMWFIPNK